MVRRRQHAQDTREDVYKRQVWIPAAVILVTLTAAEAMILIGKTSKRYQEWKRRRKIARTLWEAMHGLTLNSVGPIYGVKRKAGELNKRCV